MKKIFALISLTIFSIFIFTLYKESRKTQPVAPSISFNLPKETFFLTELPAINSYRKISPDLNSKAYSLFSGLIEEYGYRDNKLTINEFFEKAGLDLDKPWGAFFISNESIENITTNIYFNKLKEGVELRKRLETIDSFLVSDEEYPIYMISSNFIIPSVVDNRIVFSIGKDSLATVNEVYLLHNFEKSLAESPDFNKHIENSLQKSDFFLYGSNRLLTLGLSAIENEIAIFGTFNQFIEELHNVEGFLVTANTLGGDLNILYSLSFKDDALSLKTYRELNPSLHTLLNSKNHPLILAIDHNSLNLTLRELLSNDTLQLRESLNELNSVWGIDLEELLEEGLGSTAGMAVYDGNSISLTRYNTIFSFSVKDRSIIEKNIEALIYYIENEIPMASARRSQIDGVDAYIFSFAGFINFHAGFSGSEFFITTERSIFRDASTGSVQSGFTKEISPRSRREIVRRGENPIFYLNFNEVRDLISSITPILRSLGAADDNKTFVLNQINSYLSHFETIFTATTVKENLISTKISIETNSSKDFFEEINKLINQ